MTVWQRVSRVLCEDWRNGLARGIDYVVVSLPIVVCRSWWHRHGCRKGRRSGRSARTKKNLRMGVRWLVAGGRVLESVS